MSTPTLLHLVIIILLAGLVYWAVSFVAPAFVALIAAVLVVLVGLSQYS